MKAFGLLSPALTNPAICAMFVTVTVVVDVRVFRLCRVVVSSVVRVCAVRPVCEVMIVTVAA